MRARDRYKAYFALMGAGPKLAALRSRNTPRVNFAENSDKNKWGAGRLTSSRAAVPRHADTLSEGLYCPRK
jgi:hypothetical protein